MMTPIRVFLSVLLVLGGSAVTVKAADSAKPGDFLFPLDRALETVQIKIAPSEKKKELKIKFAWERVAEIQEILEEENEEKKTSGDLENSPSATSTQSFTSVSIATSTPTSTSSSEAQADFPKAKRIEDALATAVQFIASMREEFLQEGNENAVSILDTAISSLVEQANVAASLKVEVERENGSLKVKIKSENKKGGENEVEMEYKDKQEDSTSEDSRIEIEAEQEGANFYTVEVEYQGKEMSFSATSSDRTQLIEKIREKTGISIEEINNVLQIDVRKRIKTEKHEEKKTNESKTRDDDSKRDNNGEDNGGKNRDTDDSEEVKNNSSAPTSIIVTQKKEDHGGKDTEDGEDETMPSQEIKEIEAEIKGEYVQVKMEWENREEKFVSRIVDRKMLVLDISDRYGIPEELVDSILVFKVED